ncbi:MAG: ABC transporter permease [Rhodobacteraceae bacterium]|nr:ABC transporter permease [Paracoccaceae bacterium]
MAEVEKPKTLLYAAADFLGLIYHSIVREVRTKSGSASLGILSEVMQIMSFFAIFYIMFMVMGRSVAIRGDFILFLLSGIFLLVIHMGAIGAVRGASNAISPMMQHAPMSVILSIISKSLATLYLQITAIIVITLIYFVVSDGFVIYKIRSIFIPFFFTWASGISIGLIFMLLQPLAPGFIRSFSQVYMRAQMITSGKFMPAAYLPTSMVAWFDWNPLFHCIDQMRLAVFINYSKEVSNMSYPIYFTAIFLVIGLMGEFWTRKNLSSSKHGK